MSMTRRRLLDDTFKKSVVGNPAIATDSLARMYPGIVMNGWTTQDGTPTPETPVPIVSAGTQNQETGKWEYEVELSGGNLINELDARYNEIYFTYENGKFTCVKGASTYVYFERDLPAGEYSWSVNCDEIEGSGEIEVRNNNNETLYRSTFSDPGRKNLIFTLEETTECRLLFGDNSNSAITFSKPMLNPGSTALPYTPYRPPQTVTLTADRPLTKWDRLEKRNGQWGWVYKSAEIVLDGSEKWYLTSATSDEYQGFALRSSDYNAMKSNLKLVCDKFAYSTSDKINTCRQENSEYGLRFVVSIEYVPNKTVADWENWLQSNPITVLYQLAEPTFVPLTASEQEQMNALHTFRPTTVLSNDEGCEMSLTYKTKKSLEVTT